MMLGLMPGCKRPAEPLPAPNQIAAAKPVVCVDSYTLSYFAHRIGGSEVEVVFPVPSMVDPNLWQPEEAGLAAYRRADAVLLTGAGYAPWSKSASLQKEKLVDTSAAFASTQTARQSNSGDIPWIDFNQAARQAEAVLDIILRLAPDNAELLALNHEMLRQELLELDARMMAAGKAMVGQTLLLSGPGYGCWARRYALRTQTFDVDDGFAFTDERMAALKSLIITHRARWMIWANRSVMEMHKAKFEELGVKSVLFEPCDRRPEGRSWLKVMQDNVRAMEAAAGL